MAKVQINDDYTVPASGLLVDSGLGNVLIGGMRVNLTSSTFPFTIPGGTVVAPYTTQEFVIFGDDTGFAGPSAILPQATSDGTAATAGVPVGGFYRNSRDVQIRIT